MATALLQTEPVVPPIAVTRESLLTEPGKSEPKFRSDVADRLKRLDRALTLPREIVLDLAPLPWPDSLAINALTAAVNICDRHGVRLRLLGVSGHHRELFRMVNLDGRVEFGEVRRG